MSLSFLHRSLFFIASLSLCASGCDKEWDCSQLSMLAQECLQRLSNFERASIKELYIAPNSNWIPSSMDFNDIHEKISNPIRLSIRAGYYWEVTGEGRGDKGNWNVGLLNCGLKVFIKDYSKDEESRAFIAAELAAYHASRVLNIKLVPPTNIEETNEYFKMKQLYIAQGLPPIDFDLKNPWLYVDKKDRSDLRLFRAVIGCHDNHGGNTLFHYVGPKAYIASIDHESAAYNYSFEETHRYELNPDPAPYEIIYYQSTINSIKSITLQKWKEIFAKGIELAPQFYNDTWFEKFINRKEAIINHLESSGKITNDL